MVALLMGAATANAQDAHIGKRAPEIALKTLDGKAIKLSALRGSPVVISFWNSWCTSCREEFPALLKTVERHTASGLKVLLVNESDQERSDSKVKGFLAPLNVPFPVAMDRRGTSRRTYRLFGLPTTVLVDSAGVIRKFWQGPVSVTELERGIADFLSAPPVSPA